MMEAAREKEIETVLSVFSGELNYYACDMS